MLFLLPSLPCLVLLGSVVGDRILLATCLLLVRSEGVDRLPKGRVIYVAMDVHVRCVRILLLADVRVGLCQSWH